MCSGQVMIPIRENADAIVTKGCQIPEIGIEVSIVASAVVRATHRIDVRHEDQKLRRAIDRELRAADAQHRRRGRWRSGQRSVLSDVHGLARDENLRRPRSAASICRGSEGHGTGACSIAASYGQPCGLTYCL